MEGDFGPGSVVVLLGESDRDLGVDSEIKMQSHLRSESGGLLPSECWGDCGRDLEGGLRMGLRLDSQGQTRGPVTAVSAPPCLRISATTQCLRSWSAGSA
jgi:hypothetical protein